METYILIIAITAAIIVLIVIIFCVRQINKDIEKYDYELKNQYGYDKFIEAINEHNAHRLSKKKLTDNQLFCKMIKKRKT